MMRQRRKKGNGAGQQSARRRTGASPLFTEVIKRFFDGEYDAATTVAIAAELDSPRDDTPRDLVKSDVPGGVSVRGKKSRNLDS